MSIKELINNLLPYQGQHTFSQALTFLRAIDEGQDAESNASQARKTLIATLPEMLDDEGTNELCKIAYNTLLVLAEYYPINTKDPFILEEIIKDDRLVTTSGHQFNLYALAEHFHQSQKFTNPFDGLEFSQFDQTRIRSIFGERKIALPAFDSEARLLRETVFGRMTTTTTLFASTNNTSVASLLNATDLNMMNSAAALSATETFCHNQDGFSEQFKYYSDLTNLMADISNPAIIKLIFQTALSDVHFSRIFRHAIDINYCKWSLEQKKEPGAIWKMNALVVDELIYMLEEKVFSPLCHNQDGFSERFKYYSHLTNLMSDISSPAIIKLIFQTALSDVHFSRIFRHAFDINNCKWSLEQKKEPGARWKMNALVVDELINMLEEKVFSPNELQRLVCDSYCVDTLQAAFPSRSDEIASLGSTSHNFGRK